jgi:epoxide hydrolase-like predicted phosphatase
MIKALIFDLGGVIAFNDLDNMLKAYAKEMKIDFEKLKEVEAECHEKLILGKLSVKEFCSSIRSKFSLELDSLDLMLAWEKNYGANVKMNMDLIDKIRELKKNYKIALVSNIMDTTARYHQRQKLYYFFKPFLLSCRIGLAKPDIKIFARALQELGVKGSEVVYIDDNDKYLKVAKEFKMKTVKFEDNKQLFKELKKLKIK